jgi:hypothetical protein
MFSLNHKFPPFGFFSLVQPISVRHLGVSLLAGVRGEIARGVSTLIQRGGIFTYTVHTAGKLWGRVTCFIMNGVAFSVGIGKEGVEGFPNSANSFLVLCFFSYVYG